MMESIQQDNETLSLKKIIIYYISHWKVFLVSGVIALIFALLYLILTPRTYEMTTRVQLLEDKGTSGSGFNMGDASGVMRAFGLSGISGSGLNLDDEMVKFMSTTTLRKVVLELGLNASYYKPYAYDYKMYDNSPLLLTADSLTQETLDHTVRFDVKINSSGNVKVKVETEDDEASFEYSTLPAEIKLKEGTFMLSYRKDVVKPLNLDLDFSPAIWVAEGLSKSLVYDDYSKSANIIEISCTDYEKKRGLDLLRTLVSVYNSQEDSIKKHEQHKSIRFLNERLETVVADLADVEMKIEQYKLQNKMTSIEYDVQFYVENMKELQTKIIELEAQIRLVDLLDVYVKDPQNKYNLVPAIFSAGGGESITNPVMTYNEALLERAKLMQSTKKENPLIEQINKQVDQLRESVFLSIANAKTGLVMTLDDLKGKEKVILNKMGDVPTLEREYIDFRRQQEIYQALYLILLQKREDLMLSVGEKKDRVRVVEVAYVKKKAVAPRKLYALIGMVMFTMVFAVGYLFGKEQYVALKEEYKKSKL